ncbi:hypothetical protein [Clostridium oryzae]|uniref:Spore coat protein GerQ n=1 Tax=Clostridium oryzae TaxID=1450648 RepID=A0A1V4IP24_9CLOT|nr:hypothetical protein [Clostridium oryzae]OPJ61643.1 hypothetical protein CLORY_21430 [Clostridium oryzae]
MSESFCDDCLARQNNANIASGCGTGGWNAGAWTLGGNQQNAMGQQVPINQQAAMNQQASLPQSAMQQPIMGSTAANLGGMPGAVVSGGGAGMQQPSGAFPSPVPGVDFVQAPGSPVFQGQGYTQAFLRRNIGRNMRVEFLIGTNLLTDRTGTLLEVGISYIVLQPTDSDDQLMCDIYSIVFVTVYY